MVEKEFKSINFIDSSNYLKGENSEILGINFKTKIEKRKTLCYKIQSN